MYYHDDWTPTTNYPPKSIVLVGGKRAVVIANADEPVLHPLLAKGGLEDVVVAVRDESAPRAVISDDISLAPQESKWGYRNDAQVLCDPDEDSCHTYGYGSECGGVAYFDVQQYGGAWYVTVARDDEGDKDYLDRWYNDSPKEIDVMFASEKEARAYAVNIAVTHILEEWNKDRATLSEYDYSGYDYPDEAKKDDEKFYAQVSERLEEQAQNYIKWAQEAR